MGMNWIRRHAEAKSSGTNETATDEISLADVLFSGVRDGSLAEALFSTVAVPVLA